MGLLKECWLDWVEDISGDDVIEKFKIEIRMNNGDVFYTDIKENNAFLAQIKVENKLKVGGQIYAYTKNGNKVVIKKENISSIIATEKHLHDRKRTSSSKQIKVIGVLLGVIIIGGAWINSQINKPLNIYTPTETEQTDYSTPDNQWRMEMIEQAEKMSK